MGRCGDWARTAAPAARRVSLVAPEEIDAAVLRVVEAAVGIDSAEAAVEVTRLFGFARTTEAMRQPIARAVSRLSDRGTLENADGHLRLTAT